MSASLSFVAFDIECPVSCKLGPVNVTKYLCPFNEITFQGGLRGSTMLFLEWVKLELEYKFNLTN